MIGGSNQQRQFRIAIRDGMELNAAADMAGIGLAEAKLIIADDAKFPPPPEAFQLITSPIQGQPKEAAMARAARKPKDENGGVAVKVKDFALAVSIYRNDIKPANADSGSAGKVASDGYKAIKKNAHIQNQSARTAFQIGDKMEESQAEDWLRGFVGIINELKGYTVMTFHGDDLVDRAERDDGYARPRPVLVTVPHDGDNSDLADAAEPEFTEATAEELAQQEGRPAADTGAPDEALEEGADD